MVFSLLILLDLPPLHLTLLTISSLKVFLWHLWCRTLALPPNPLPSPRSILQIPLLLSSLWKLDILRTRLPILFTYMIFHSFGMNYHLYDHICNFIPLSRPRHWALLSWHFHLDVSNSTHLKLNPPYFLLNLLLLLISGDDNMSPKAETLHQALIFVSNEWINVS